jgi:hypothetical protein
VKIRKRIARHAQRRVGSWHLHGRSVVHSAVARVVRPTRPVEAAIEGYNTSR